jgi:hypothetical protein
MAVTSNQSCEPKLHLREGAIYSDSSNNIISTALNSRGLLRLRLRRLREYEIRDTRLGDRSYQEERI